MPTCFHGAPSTAILALAALGTLATACADGDQLVLGRRRIPDGGSQASGGTSAAGFGNAGTGAANSLDASSPRPSSLRVQIEREAVAVEIVTVQCAGECVDVEAVARGGFPPYSYAWEDGSTEPVRRLCPRATTPFTVTATDSGLASVEFQQKPSTAKSTVTAEVLACSDAGPRPDGGASTPDGGPAGAQCARDPSASSSASPSCTTLNLAPCGDGMIMAELPVPLEVGESGCFIFEVREPLAAVWNLGSIQFSAGADACAGDDVIGSFDSPAVATDTGWSDHLCVAPRERITRVGLPRVSDVFDEPFELELRLCDACPQ